MATIWDIVKYEYTLTKVQTKSYKMICSQTLYINRELNCVTVEKNHPVENQVNQVHIIHINGIRLIQLLFEQSGGDASGRYVVRNVLIFLSDWVRS